MSGLGSDWVFSFNNYLFGGPGQGVQILQVDGLEDLPGLRVQDDNRGYADGMFTGRDFLNGRSIIVTCSIMSDASNSMQTYVQKMKASLVSQQQGTYQLFFKLPNRPLQYINARVRKRVVTIDPEYVYGRAKAVIEFFCPDPRIYDNTPQTYTLSPVTISGRLIYIPSNPVGSQYYSRSYPTPSKSWSYSYSSGYSNQKTVYNTGNYQVYPQYRFTGSCTNPVIQNQLTGQLIGFNITLGASDYLDVDSDLKTVVFNGSVNARNTLMAGSQWFAINPATDYSVVPPTPNVPLLFSTLKYDVSNAPTCTITYHNANI